MVNKLEDLKRQKAEFSKQRHLRAQFEGTLTKRNRSVSPGYQFKPEQDDFATWTKHISRSQ